MSCSRSSCISSLRMPCLGVVLGVLMGDWYPPLPSLRMHSTIEMERVPESLWRRIRAEPDRAPEHIALAAAERFGPAAEEWIRVAGGGHTPARPRRAAYRKTGRGGRGSAG